MRSTSTDLDPTARALVARGKGIKALAEAPVRRSPRALTASANGSASTLNWEARFTKWRAVSTIGSGLPSEACLHTNAVGLARFATLPQEASLVPMSSRKC